MMTSGDMTGPDVEVILEICQDVYNNVKPKLVY